MKTAIIIALVIGLAAAIVWFLLRDGAGPGHDAAKPADAGKGLRLMALSRPVGEWGFRSDTDYPSVFGVIVDWNLGDQTASILAMRDGSASLYTTSAFGILGGQGRAEVRRAAEVCVKAAGRYYDKGVPVSDFAYPNGGKVHFYLLCYDGVRLCVGEEAGIAGGTDPMRPLFTAAQDVLTELRLMIGPPK